MKGEGRKWSAGRLRLIIFIRGGGRSERGRGRARRGERENKFVLALNAAMCM